MFIQLHVICIFMLFMKHQDVHNDWFMWTKVSYVWINLGFCRKICLRISRAVAVTKKCPHFWNARISTELQPVQNLRIFSNNLMMFKIDLRKLQTHWAIWCSKPAHHRSRFKAAWSGNRRKQWQFKFLFDIEPQRYSGEIPIGSDIIHVSGRDRKDDLEDDDLAPPKPWSQHWVRLIYFNIRNLEKLKRIYQSKLLN